MYDWSPFCLMPGASHIDMAKFTNEITDVTEVSYLGFRFKDIMIEMNKKCPDLSPTKESYRLVIKTYTKFLRQICFFKHLKHSKFNFEAYFLLSLYMMNAMLFSDI